VKTIEDAVSYIKKILQNQNIAYWVVRKRKNFSPIGVVTFIKRDYLDHHDIGFAFLPEYTKRGFAYEASQAVLNEVRKTTLHRIVLATTKIENQNSIGLLHKLGMKMDKEIEVEGIKLLIFTT
jgi:RimJ/RimL family protein N-acetyltransferase